MQEDVAVVQESAVMAKDGVVMAQEAVVMVQMHKSVVESAGRRRDGAEGRRCAEQCRNGAGGRCTVQGDSHVAQDAVTQEDGIMHVAKWW
jgi:hypothetical protein